ncbi:MAG: transcriptional regulator, MerR family [bacterium]|nr:transcriptional regulator, MerR family [bacterium]
MKQAYTSRDVAQIVGISESRVRYWAQTGVVGPSDRAGGRAVYTFQDLVGVRAAKELLDGGVSLQRARKNLDALRQQLGVDRPLSKLRVRSDGESLVVSDGSTTFEPTTGQLVIDFTLEDLTGQLAEFSAPTAPAPTTKAESAWAWFVEGGDCEQRGEDDRALIAYQKALEGDPALAAAHTNLGNLLYRRGQRGEAREHYETALSLDAEQPEARYNLANLLDDTGDPDGARMEWYRVVASCPEFADAHYNLALACARDGDGAAGRFHLSRYMALRPDDARAAELLARL